MMVILIYIYNYIYIYVDLVVDYISRTHFFSEINPYTPVN